MTTFNSLRRLVMNYIVLLGILSALVIMVDASGRLVQNAVDTLEATNQQVGGVSR